MTDLHLEESSNPPYDELFREEIEQRLGVQLPASYVDLLKRWNGGYFPTTYEIRLDNPIPDSLKDYLSDGFWSLSLMAGIARDAPTECSLMYLIESAEEWGLPPNIVPLEGDGHTWVAFDYREPGVLDPPIIFLESDNYQTFLLAKNFAELLDKLLPYEDVYDNDGNIVYKH